MRRSDATHVLEKHNGIRVFACDLHASCCSLVCIGADLPVYTRVCVYISTYICTNCRQVAYIYILIHIVAHCDNLLFAWHCSSV